MLIPHLSLFTGGGRGGEGDLESDDLFLWPLEVLDLVGSLGDSWPLVSSFLLLRSLERMEELVIFIRRNSPGLIFRSRKFNPFSINFSAIEIIWMASLWWLGGLREDTEGRHCCPLAPPSPLLMTLSTTIGFSSMMSSFLPQFSLALSGGIPVPPFSMDQGALPDGHGYSLNVEHF